MFNQGGVKTTATTNVRQILFNTETFISTSIVVSATGVTAGADGKKIIPAGTPMAGDITKRGTAFTVGADTNAVGVLLHDVDVTAGNANGSLLLFGAVNLDRLDPVVKAKFTAAMITKLSRIFFLGNN